MNLNVALTSEYDLQSKGVVAGDVSKTEFGGNGNIELAELRGGDCA